MIRNNISDNIDHLSDEAISYHATNSFSRRRKTQFEMKTREVMKEDPYGINQFVATKRHLIIKKNMS